VDPPDIPRILNLGEIFQENPKARFRTPFVGRKVPGGGSSNQTAPMESADAQSVTYCHMSSEPW
ncbi:hypothetical protein VQ042_01860, partial [Aurantimonas sp. A2-1-M11]|uniref:hypothetical protein n=1 Tax=Aurantimonas sp. A2-1-M11 TaxID=3113712 RepID=UPI002F9583B5